MFDLDWFDFLDLLLHNGKNKLFWETSGMLIFFDAGRKVWTFQTLLTDFYFKIEVKVVDLPAFLMNAVIDNIPAEFCAYTKNEQSFKAFIRYLYGYAEANSSTTNLETFVNLVSNLKCHNYAKNYVLSFDTANKEFVYTTKTTEKL